MIEIILFFSTFIDVFLTNNPYVVRETNVIPVSIGDHDMIGAVRKANFVKFLTKNTTYRDYRNYDANVICDQLRESNWGEVYSANDVESAWKK